MIIILICGIHLHYVCMLCTHVGVPFQVHLSGVHSCLQWRVSIRLAIKSTVGCTFHILILYYHNKYARLNSCNIIISYNDKLHTIIGNSLVIMLSNR